MLCHFIYLLSLCILATSIRAQSIHQAYVWQRNWTPRLVQAIDLQSNELQGLTVLFAELSISKRTRVSQCNVDYDALKRSKRPITLALRINLANASKDSIEDSFQQHLAKWCEVAVETARANGLKPAAIEIDFDCPTSQLEHYAHALRLLRAPIDEVKLSITTLPSWMTRPQAFKQLVHACDHYVLQVHSIDRALNLNDEAQLCDPIKTRRWIQQAAEFQSPFHLALPTYAYQLAYNKTGKLVNIESEGGSAIKNPNWTYRIIRADPVTLSKLAHELSTALPENCQGIIWYRLPINDEAHNWDMETWRAVRTSPVSQSTKWSLQAVPTVDGAIELQISHQASTSQPPPEQVKLHWHSATALAWDGQHHYQVALSKEGELTFHWPQQMPPPVIIRDTTWTIGWVRFDRETKLTLSSN